MNLASLFAAALMAFTGTTSTPPIQVCVDIPRNLYLGMSGEDVMRLQRFLGVRATGYFGPITKNAVRAWQLQNGVIAHARAEGAGILGPKTRTAMSCSKPIEIVSPINVTLATPSATSSTPTTTVTVTSVPAVPFLPQSSGGGGGAYNSAPQCQPFTTMKPSATECPTGAWILTADEAGCPAEWYCDNPNEIE